MFIYMFIYIISFSQVILSLLWIMIWFAISKSNSFSLKQSNSFAKSSFFRLNSDATSASPFLRNLQNSMDNLV